MRDTVAAEQAPMPRSGPSTASSSNGQSSTIDELLSDRILVEAPRDTVEKPRAPGAPVPGPPTSGAKPQ